MKIKFVQPNIKVLVTRISGKFHIYNEDEQKWDEKLTQGSFKCEGEMYDRILKAISEMKSLYRYRITKDCCELQLVYLMSSSCSTIHFDIVAGRITDVKIKNPEVLKPEFDSFRHWVWNLPSKYFKSFKDIPKQYIETLLDVIKENIPIIEDAHPNKTIEYPSDVIDIFKKRYPKDIVRLKMLYKNHLLSGNGNDAAPAMLCHYALNYFNSVLCWEHILKDIQEECKICGDKK